MSAAKIALTGPMRAGKSVVSGMIVLHYGFQPFAFGDRLKEAAHFTFPNVSRDPKPRALYQSYGQYMREIDPDIWVRRCFDDIAEYERLQGGPQRVLLTDLRQPNEYAECKRRGFTIIGVQADDATRQARMEAEGDEYDPAALTHETERHFEDFDCDYVIDNGAGTSLVDLEEQVAEIMRELGVQEVGENTDV